jgi:DNA-binding NarL/FixJ family response regulator
MATPVPTRHRVLIVESDPRVRTGLAALINATPGLAVVAVCDRATRASYALGLTQPAVAVVGMSNGVEDVRALAALVPQLPLVAVSARTSDADRALAMGATGFCDQGGDTDLLSATVLSAAQNACPHSSVPASGAAIATPNAGAGTPWTASARGDGQRLR